MIYYILTGGLIAWLVYEKAHNTAKISDGDLVINVRFQNRPYSLRLTGQQIGSLNRIDVPEYPTITTEVNNTKMVFGLPNKVSKETKVIFSKMPRDSIESTILPGKIDWDAEFDLLRDKLKNKGKIPVPPVEITQEVTQITQVKTARKRSPKKKDPN